ncbi:hypothetical protein CMUS01_06153 [Colletotrichum musicola]|uniref:Uncharacterized protein n=1 Tax=Colletotrichum musicola TaxID=2175873 RepID=A0A8H6KP96_9PEZI|nr:hypothetical protein CMUS01_06153 [Colletotrichum musicola]
MSQFRHKSLTTALIKSRSSANGAKVRNIRQGVSWVPPCARRGLSTRQPGSVLNHLVAVNAAASYVESIDCIVAPDWSTHLVWSEVYAPSVSVEDAIITAATWTRGRSTNYLAIPCGNCSDDQQAPCHEGPIPAWTKNDGEERMQRLVFHSTKA